MKLHNQQKSLQNQNNHNTLLDNFTAQYSETSLYCMAMAYAEEFIPKRWINNGVFQPESLFKFVAFHAGAGPRMSLRKDFAYIK
ncbi:hypothetical protein P8452_13692 [Trifolium repens]|nr:hypothetical protein P8452_13692 [Trifolium repens]